MVLAAERKLSTDGLNEVDDKEMRFTAGYGVDFGVCLETKTES